MDRQYFRFAEAWHGLRDYEHPPNDTVSILYRSLCGEVINLSWVEESDRVPADGHLCQRCGRIIAAQTDIETEPSPTNFPVPRAPEMLERDRVSDVPEPVASEQDDSGIAPI